MLGFLNKINLFYPYQFGFRAALTTEDGIKYIDHCTMAYFVRVYFFYVKNAFDSVSHNTLDKLYSLGCIGFFNFFKSCLVDQLLDYLVSLTSLRIYFSPFTLFSVYKFYLRAKSNCLGMEEHKIPSREMVVYFKYWWDKILFGMGEFYNRLYCIQNW